MKQSILQQALVLFTRVPVAGRTKTRLESILTPEECMQLQYELLINTITEFSLLDCDLIVCYSDDYETEEHSLEALESFKQRLLSTYHCKKRALYFTPQAKGSLGARLEAVFDETLRKGYEKCLVMGSDIPFVSPEDINDLFKLLDGADIVFGPSPDGGYWITGMKQPFPSLFDHKTYSSESVLAEALETCNKFNKTVALGPEKFDIDTPYELERYRSIQKTLKK